MSPLERGRDLYRRQLVAVSGGIAFWFSMAVSIVIFGPTPVAVGLSIIVAIFGSIATFLLVSQSETLADRIGEFASASSIVMRDEIVAAVGSVLHSLRIGLIAAAGSAALAVVAWLLTILNLAAVPGLSLIALAVGLVAVLSAVHTRSVLFQVSRMSEGTVWRGPLVRASVFGVCAAAFTALTGAVAILLWVVPQRNQLLDNVSFIVAFLTFGFVVDTRDATIKAAMIATPSS